MKEIIKYLEEKKEEEKKIKEEEFFGLENKKEIIEKYGVELEEDVEIGEVLVKDFSEVISVLDDI